MTRFVLFIRSGRPLRGVPTGGPRPGDLDELLKTVERSGPIVDISDNEDRMLIVVE